jgi:hypothetical protein
LLVVEGGTHDHEASIRLEKIRRSKARRCADYFQSSFILAQTPEATKTTEATKPHLKLNNLKQRLQQLEQTVVELKGQINAIEETKSRVRLSHRAGDLFGCGNSLNGSGTDSDSEAGRRSAHG